MKILITSALPYVNNVPHLGNIVGAVLSADVYARFCRSYGHDVIYVCGTDEHGTATETKALEEGVSPKEICDKYYRIHKDIYDWFNIRFDYFGRTSTPAQTEITQDIFLKLLENGYISEERVEQLYCRSCDKFLADRFVEGICPYCGYEEARGDQCDKCQKVINAPELKNPRCKICGSTPVIEESDHLFIDLPKLEPKLKEWIESRKSNWSQNARTFTYAWLEEGLKKRSITRDLKWGVPVPLEKFKDKVFYVWFDAPIGYISMTKKAFPDSWKEWWFNDYDEEKQEGVALKQFMGKDNIPFHTIIFPASLLGSGDPYTMLYSIHSTEYLNYEDTKFSKSRGIGLFGDQAKDTGIPADVFRYYLLVNRPERSDSNFSWHDLMEKTNNELVANFGNLVNRTLYFINRFFEGDIPLSEETGFIEKVKEEEDKVTELLSAVELKEALRQIMHISRLGNQFFQEQEPWKTIKTDRKKCESAMFQLANLVKDLGIMIEPYMPDISVKISKLLNTDNRGWQDIGKMSVSGRVAKPEILFRKIEESRIEELKQTYGGKKKFALDLRVAKITEVREHENSDKLLIIQIDLGDEKRQVVAGLKGIYDASELLGKQVVVVANLKPAKLGGELSQGMILAAEKDGLIRINEAPDAHPGERMAPKGMETEKKQIGFNEFKAHDLKIIDGKICVEREPLVTKHGSHAGTYIEDGALVR